MKVKVIVSLLLAAVSLPSTAQNVFRDKFTEFTDKAVSDYDDFRRECNRKYSDFIRQAWEQYLSLPPRPEKERKHRPPVFYDREAEENEPVREVMPTLVPHSVGDAPQAKPLGDILTPPSELPRSPFEFTFFGTRMKLNVTDGLKYTLRSTLPDDVADGWNMLSGGRYDVLLGECLRLRGEYHLCDWAYLMMLVAFSDAFTGSDDESILLTAWLYSQSGYQMRLGLSKNRLTLLFSSDYKLLGIPYYEMGGESYYQINRSDGDMQVVNFPFPDERRMSMLIREEPELDDNPSEVRKWTSGRGDISISCTVNLNLLKFYSLYPASQSNENPLTRWALNADVPMDSSLRGQIYPALEKKSEGKDEAEAAGILLRFVQTAFRYEEDEKIWGRDRAFFCEETLYYPGCDCEDRAILFSRLVRDILGLDVVLVHYPDHLSSAVKFHGEVGGDCVVVDGERYVICDPTYINAPVGKAMRGVSGTDVRVIKLHR